MSAGTLRAAVGQFAPVLGDVPANLARCDALVAAAAADGAELVVLPECALTGYMFDDAAEAEAVARRAGPALAALEALVARQGTSVVIGTLACDDDGALRNRAVLLGPEGAVAAYDKTHLPYMGADRFVTAGDAAFEAVATPRATVALQVCYDLRFPEVTRCQVLDGAQVIAHPTNWGMVAARTNADFMTRARAFESGVFLLTANRVGTENGMTFCGRSQIVDPQGQVVALAGETGEALLVADLELERTGKHIVVEEAVYEMDLLGDRRPDLYGPLGAPAAAAVPRTASA